MTTIAWDGKKLASDSLSTSGNMRLSGDCIKTKRIGKYRVAFTGDNAPAFHFFESFLKDEMELGDLTYDPVSPSVDDFSLMVIEDEKESCMVFNSSTGYWDEFFAPISIGSGSKYALGSMYSGCDADKAVEVACMLDTHSGLPVKIEE